MKIDLHVHARERSLCCRSSQKAQVEAAIAAGLDAIVFTDHHRLAHADKLDELNETYAPFKIYGGVELTIGGEDILVLGIHDPILETKEFTYPELHAFVRERSGFMAVAHPYRFHPGIKLPLAEYLPDAIEVCSSNTRPEMLEEIVALARQLNIAPLSNSDAHAAKIIGSHYNVLDHPVNSEAELVEALRRGRFSCLVPGSDGAVRRFRKESIDGRKHGSAKG